MGAGGYTGVFLMGTTLVITSFTCTAPFVGSLLFATGAQARSFGQILVGMTFFGLTMAVPFVGLALFPDLKRSLPRSGEWMHTLKVTLGFIELAAALKFISNVEYALKWYILPRELFLYLTAAIALTTALYLLGMVRLRGESGEVGPLRLLWGMLFLIAALYFFHYTEVKHPNWLMAAFLPPYSSSEPPETAGDLPGRVKKTPTAVEWTLVEDDFEGGLEKARAEGKLALVNWTGFL